MRTGKRAFAGVDDADYHCRLSGPLLAPRRGNDSPAVFANPTQPGTPRVTLADRVGGDEAESPSLSEQVERSSEEVGDKIRVAMRLIVDRFEPVDVSLDAAFGERGSSRKGRIAHEGVETRVLPIEDFEELDLPVKGNDRVGCAS